MDIDQDELGGPLPLRIWVTRGCFFTLAERLKLKAKYSVIATTLLSFYVITTSLILLAFPDKVSSTNSKWLNALTIVTSILIIIITLLEHSSNYAKDEECAARTARLLAELYDQVIVSENVDLKLIGKNYAEILRESRVDYDMIDYHSFQIAHPEAFKHSNFKWVLTVLIFIWEYIKEYWLYAVMAFGPPIFIIKFGMLIFDGRA